MFRLLAALAVFFAIGVSAQEGEPGQARDGTQCFWFDMLGRPNHLACPEERRQPLDGPLPEREGVMWIKIAKGSIYRGVRYARTANGYPPAIDPSRPSPYDKPEPTIELEGEGQYSTVRFPKSTRPDGAVTGRCSADGCACVFTAMVNPSQGTGGIELLDADALGYFHTFAAPCPEDAAKKEKLTPDAQHVWAGGQIVRVITPYGVKPAPVAPKPELVAKVAEPAKAPEPPLDPSRGLTPLATPAKALPAAPARPAEPQKVVDFHERPAPPAAPAPSAGPSWLLLIVAVLLAGGVGVYAGRISKSKAAAVARPRTSFATQQPLTPPNETPTLLQTQAPSAEVLGIPRQRTPLNGLIRGRYEIKGKIGAGGMGIVYEGFDHSLERRVAIKQMRSEIRNAEKERATFLREAKIISHLTNPYIVAIHEVVEQGEEIYLVFDFVDGKPLSQILAERKRVPLAEAQKIFSFVCEAMTCAHGAHILHRDLKPSNIMVGVDGYAKVMDFGIAREAKDTITRLTHADTSGTPAYMAPEQHLGRAAKASDIYALGICLYETLTGQLPFPGPDFLAQKERMKYPPPQFLAPDLPKEVEILFQAALAADPKKRVGDAAELAEALKGLKA